MEHSVYLERSARIDRLDELVEQIEERMTAFGYPKPEVDPWRWEHRTPSSAGFPRQAARQGPGFTAGALSRDSQRSKAALGVGLRNGADDRRQHTFGAPTAPPRPGRSSVAPRVKNVVPLGHD